MRHGGTSPQVHALIVTRSAGKWPVPTILRVEVGRGAPLSMSAAEHEVSLLVEGDATRNKANVTFLPLRDEPEIIPFYG